MMHIAVDMHAFRSLEPGRSTFHCFECFLRLLSEFKPDELSVTLLCNGYDMTWANKYFPLAGNRSSSLRMRIWWPPDADGFESASAARRTAAGQIRRSVIHSLQADVVLLPVRFPVQGEIFLDIPTLFCLIEESCSQWTSDRLHQHAKWLKAAESCLLITTRQKGDLAPLISTLGIRMIPVFIEPCRMAAAGQAEALVPLWSLLQSLPQQHHGIPDATAFSQNKPLLACVTPLPPERTGIAEYCAELLPQLERYYRLEVVCDQKTVTSPWMREHCTLRSVAWFREHGHRYERVLYHIGNSRYHHYMFSLLQDVPGVVVLHDFFLGDVQRFREASGSAPFAFSQALLKSHGYQPVLQQGMQTSPAMLVQNFPCNFGSIEWSTGIVVHSRHALELGRHWYPNFAAVPWQVIPHVRVPTDCVDREKARQAIEVGPEDFVVCSFGVLGTNKLNHMLVQAWQCSRLASRSQCLLIFVGENPVPEYCRKMARLIAESPCGGRIRITGWVEYPLFQTYLAAADLAVQLRAHSRGETSGTVLDCMNHSVPVIVNANGSMAEFPDDTVCMLPEDFTVEQLSEALETLQADHALRKRLASHGKEYLLRQHGPELCGKRYSEILEKCRRSLAANPTVLARRLAEHMEADLDDSEARRIALAIAASFPAPMPARQLFLDVTATLRDDLKTGIQRVVKALTRALFQTPPEGYRIEPVYLSDQGGRWHYRYARHWSLAVICGSDLPYGEDEPIDISSDDEMLLLDYNGPLALAAAREGLYARLKQQAVGLHAVIYDMLPIQMPHAFPPCQFGFDQWLEAMAGIVDGFLCISNAVADEVRLWLKSRSPFSEEKISVRWFHLGADIANSVPSSGLPADAGLLISALRRRPTFLMVGTIEPRKGYLQTLDAFSQLWLQQVDVNLVIVGKEGWANVPVQQRRTIPQTVKRLRDHPESGKRLFWIQGASDEYLERLYEVSACLIVASEGEGFGLPLIEAAQHRLPIIARDIPVFREVAQSCAYYFPDSADSAVLAKSIADWLLGYERNAHQRSDAMPWLTWQQSSEQLVSALFND
jgi:glycosyltransferase involved in cell wall biosynthesis